LKDGAVADVPVVLVWPPDPPPDCDWVVELPLLLLVLSSPPPLATATTMATIATTAAATSSPTRWFLDIARRKYG
jgi:hypothetical protein